MKKILQAAAVTSFFALIVTSVFAASPMIYPEKGQSSQQQEQDKYSCYQWAKQQTGFDPQAAGVAAPGQPAPGGGAVPGAAKGAAAGAVGGAIAGNPGKGAAIGAGVGGVAGGARRRGEEKAAAQQQQQAAAQQNQMISSFNKAQAVCLQGKGYSVG